MRARRWAAGLAPLLGMVATACSPGASGGGDPALAKALLAALPPAYRVADLAHGKSVFAVCRGCHTVVPSGADMTGPSLFGVYGRKAGSKPGYAYSAALRGAGFAWDADHLDRWLEKPRDDLPGTKMTFVGLSDPTDRRDVIAWLASASRGGPR